MFVNPDSDVKSIFLTMLRYTWDKANLEMYDSDLFETVQFSERLFKFSVSFFLPSFCTHTMIVTQD